MKGGEEEKGGRNGGKGEREGGGEGGGGWEKVGRKDGRKRDGGGGGRALLSSCGTATIGSTTYAIPFVDKATTFLSPLQEIVSIACTCRWNLEITVDYYRLLQITNLLWGILSTTVFLH